MSEPNIRATVYLSRRFVFHQDRNGVVGNRPGHRCTRKCGPVNVWAYSVTVNGEHFTGDHTGNWRVIYESALRKVVQLRGLAGGDYEPPIVRNTEDRVVS